MKKNLFLLLISFPLLLTSCNKIIEPSDSIVTEGITEIEESEILSEESIEETEVVDSESETEIISEIEEESEEISEVESEKESEKLSEKESEIESEESESESNKYLIDDPYYANIDISSKSAFNSSMQKLMFDTHKKYCSYGEIRYQFGRSDKDPNKQGNILCFYSRESMSSSWDGGKTYNREHVWPKASSGGLFSSSAMDAGGNNNYKGAGSDLHHVRPAKTDINGDRGSQRFGSYIPADEVKGDVARIIMYMYIHYSDEISCNATNRGTYVGHLKLSNVFTSTNLIASWNKLDPVDDLERARNDFCYAYQGNKNPFIDNPEWVNLALGLD